MKKIPVEFTVAAVAKQLITKNPNYELITFLINQIEHDKRLNFLLCKVSELEDRLIEIDEELAYE